MKSFISASILAADFANLGEECRSVISAGVNYIHFDVMDHHFVPNLSFGPFVCQNLRDAAISTPIDVHLMVEQPEQYIDAFAKAGANLLTFHAETVNDVNAVIAKINAAGMGAGLAFNPGNAINVSDDILQRLEMILVMSVNPGFAGQKFMPESLDKINHVRQRLDALGSSAMLGIDGGIKLENIATVAAAGANFFVLGSGIFACDDYRERIQALKQALAV